MGDDTVDSILYAINKETGQKIEFGKGFTEIPKLAPGGITDQKNLFIGLGEQPECVYSINLKTITKKRFIKLLMGRGYQKNQAIKIHKKYMKVHKTRNMLGLEMFITSYAFCL